MRHAVHDSPPRRSATAPHVATPRGGLPQAPDAHQAVVVTPKARQSTQQQPHPTTHTQQRPAISATEPRQALLWSIAGQAISTSWASTSTTTSTPPTNAAHQAATRVQPPGTHNDADAATPWLPSGGREGWAALHPDLLSIVVGWVVAEYASVTAMAGVCRCDVCCHCCTGVCLGPH